MVPRSIQQNPQWSGERYSRGQAMVDLLLLRSFTAHQVHINGHVIDLECGDLAASVRFLAERWGWSLRKVASFLARLEADNFLVKKRNGSGNGSPSVYHIANEGGYIPDYQPNGNGSGYAQDTVGIRSGDKENKGKKGKKENTGCAVTFDDFLSSFSTDDQELIHQTLSAIAATPRSRISTQAGKKGIASRLAKFPQSAVVTACRAYLDQDCAADGKNEGYLLGIVRRVTNNHQGSQIAQPKQSTHKTEGQAVLERAMADLRKEQENDLSK